VGRKYTQLSANETWARERQMIGMNRAQREIQEEEGRKRGRKRRDEA
jgi:hypothetical protein